MSDYTNYTTKVEVLLGAFSRFLQSNEFKQAMRSSAPIALGSFSFKTLPEDGVLRVLITFAQVGSAEALSGQAEEGLLKISQAVQNPQIGGMFEHGGSDVLFDKHAGRFQLVWSCKVDGITEDRFTSSLQTQFQLAAAWQLRWLPRIIDIVQNGAAIPDKPVTLESEWLFK